MIRLRPSDWYSIPVSVLRRWVTLGVLLALTGVGYLLFQQWQRYDLQQRAIQTIDQASQLIDEVENREDAALLRTENMVAWERIDGARTALVQGDYDAAYKNAYQSLMVLKSVLQIGDRDGTIRFLFVQGGVEYRRGDRGAWKRARSQDSLDPGDWVKTADDGTAEIVFSDNSTFVLRPNTMVNLGDTSGDSPDGGASPERANLTDSATNVVFGWVELTTAERPSTVSTPRSRARVSGRSEAMVSYDRDRGRGRFAAYAGGVEILAENGESRSLDTLEQVEQVGEAFGETEALPERPRVSGPPDDDEIDLDTEGRAILSWEAVDRGARYRLRISDSRLFASSIIDNRRRRTQATVGLRREGRYFWQVAAQAGSGAQGPWSEPRTFRVASLSSAGRLASDVEPPELEIEEIQSYGSLVIVKGRTEAGARVTINDEPATTTRSGSFNKTIQMTQEGWSSVEVIATDAAGNQTRSAGRVRIDVY